MPSMEMDVQELLDREVYVDTTCVGVIVGERFHPNESRVLNLRLKVQPDVAEGFMRKPAELAPLGKDLLHSIRDDGTVKLSKSMRELQRRWRNTVRIDEQLYAPDELVDRAVHDVQAQEIGEVIELVKVKRTYRAMVIRVRHTMRAKYDLPAIINVPVTAISRTRERLDDVVLSCTTDKLVRMPSFIRFNDPDTDFSEEE